MDLRDSAEEAAFRGHLRAWIAANLPASLRGQGTRTEQLEPLRKWSAALSKAGYVGLTWPQEYGGGGGSHALDAILLQELARADAPQHVGAIGLGMAGPTIMVHGTEAQKSQHLRPILDAEEIWCQGFSEPGAGSDLASVRTRSELRGDTFVVNGQKVWSSYAHIADWCILVTLSDPAAPRYHGLTYMLVDMHSKGVEVRPLRQITGEADFNEIFLTEVEVPRANVLGEIGEGWQVAMTTLLHERATLGFALTGLLDANVQGLLRLAGEHPGEANELLGEIAREWIQLQALQLTAYRSLGELDRTGMPGPEGSAIKLAWSESNQRVTKLARFLLGEEGVVDDGFWNYQQLRSRGNTIEAGTSEILRNIIAERVLGLPRSR
ncbi:MAG TPA: acyl-CoA dehydrogenase family protein [Candidatus Nanopelagicaceae bacterium]|nr:acyl-CoA dehydrogenase family protein [Candidatus Nanopelagicaceae bacterium]